jgi:hypothetical protein
MESALLLAPTEITDCGNNRGRWAVAQVKVSRSKGRVLFSSEEAVGRTVERLQKEIVGEKKRLLRWEIEANLAPICRD